MNDGRANRQGAEIGRLDTGKGPIGRSNSETLRERRRYGSHVREIVGGGGKRGECDGSVVVVTVVTVVCGR